jgi:hypothetical protein
MAHVEVSGTDWNGAVSGRLTHTNARTPQPGMFITSDRARGNLQDVTDPG